ncbi:MAG: hypothetical protein ACMVY4_15180 [Minwuia sp.]|uniref:hypothetical protein n=1 Tax=Minwuia sp. TaxID=2493630 RepID=UPI003A8A569F
MFRTVLIASAVAIALAGPASAQVRIGDPVDAQETLEEILSVPYYGSTSTGYGRAQRPIVDRVPMRILSGTGYHYTNAKYFRVVGKILTDLQDMTLYASKQDRDFGVSSVEDTSTWKPMIISENTRLTGLWGKAWNESLNAWVLTLVDKPLYRYVGDDAPGQAKGDTGDFYKLEVVG